MPLSIATDPDTSGLLERLGLTDEHPLGWLHMSPELQEAEIGGFCMILGRARQDGRRFVVAKTEAGVRAWREFARACAERWEKFPVLDETPEESRERKLLWALFGRGLPPPGVRVFDAPEGMEEHYRRAGYCMAKEPPGIDDPEG